MTLLGNTALLHNDTVVNYEILLLDKMLVFKPYFYHMENHFPCIVLNQVAAEWQFQEKIDKQVEQQILDELILFKLVAKTRLSRATDSAAIKTTNPDEQLCGIRKRA